MAIQVDPENNETRALFDMANFSGQHVLEIGCGDGQWIKRLVGLPNETISIHAGGVFVNGILLDEPYQFISATYETPEFKLDGDSYFVLGDNRPNSSDSHSWGALPGDEMVGRAIFP